MSRKTKPFLVLTFAFLSLAGILLLIPATRSYQMHMFFASGNDFLGDFLNNVSSLTIAQGFNPYHHWIFAQTEQTYPPFAYALFLPFVPLMPEVGMNITACHASAQAMLIGAIGVGLMMIVFFASLIVLCRRFSLPSWMAIVLFLSGQALACYERGNMILLAIAGIILFLCYFQDERTWGKVLAALGLALAVALKVTPVLFGLLWLNKKNFRWLMLAGGITLLLTFATLLWSDHTILENIRQLTLNATMHEERYALHSLAINPTSIFVLFFVQVLGINISVAPIVLLVSSIKLFCAGLGLVGLLLAAFRKMPLWQSFFLLAASQILIPAAPQQYVLLFFVPALVAILSSPETDTPRLRPPCSREADLVPLQRLALAILFLVIILPFPLCVFRGININFALQSLAILFMTAILVLHHLVLWRSSRSTPHAPMVCDRV